jgi:hypothetical protein
LILVGADAYTRIALNKLSEVGQVKRFKPPNQVEVLRALKHADKRAYLSAKDAAELSSLSEIRIRRLIDMGELPSILDGRSRRVLTAAVYDRLIAKAEAANPPTGPKPKANPFRGVRPNGTRGVARRCPPSSSPQKTSAGK